MAPLFLPLMRQTDEGSELIRLFMNPVDQRLEEVQLFGSLLPGYNFLRFEHRYIQDSSGLLSLCALLAAFR